MLRTLASAPDLFATRGGAVMRGHSKGGLTRRDLIKSFGPLAFLLMPVARSMG